MTDQQTATDETFMLADDDEDDSHDKHLLFKLGDEEYGVPIDRVQTIEEMHKIVAVPDMPDYVRGVINLRRGVIPVVELRRRFGMPPREFDDRTCIIVITSDSRTVGFIVDTVNEVHEIPEENIQPRPEFNAGDEKDQFVAGLGTVDGEVKILLAIDRLMRADEVPTETLELGGAQKGRWGKRGEYRRQVRIDDPERRELHASHIRGGWECSTRAISRARSAA